MSAGTEYLLVDGYNIIFAWSMLNEIAINNLEHARDTLLDMMCDLGGFLGVTIIVVFDAHRVVGGKGTEITYKNIFVVYTKEAQTADHYIEKTVTRLAPNYVVKVATSDALEQIIIMAKGAIRVSATELLVEFEIAKEKMKKKYKEEAAKQKNTLYDRLSKDAVEWLENLRRS